MNPLEFAVIVVGLLAQVAGLAFIAYHVTGHTTNLEEVAADVRRILEGGKP